MIVRSISASCGAWPKNVSIPLYLFPTANCGKPHIAGICRTSYGNNGNEKTFLPDLLSSEKVSNHVQQRHRNNLNTWSLLEAPAEPQLPKNINTFDASCIMHNNVKPPLKNNDDRSYPDQSPSGKVNVKVFSHSRKKTHYAYFFFFSRYRKIHSKLKLLTTINLKKTLG